MSEGLFIIRLALGLLLVAHGTQKLFGWYGGYGLQGTGAFFESVGHRPGHLMALAAGLSEAVGGLFLVIGFLTPWGAAMIIGTMYVASVSVHAPNGLWATNGGYELPLTNALVATGLAFTGAGNWSVDHAAGIPWTRGWGVGIGAIVVGLIAGSLVLARRQAITGETSVAAAGDSAYPAEAVPADPSTRSDAHLASADDTISLSAAEDGATRSRRP